VVPEISASLFMRRFYDLRGACQNDSPNTPPRPSFDPKASVVNPNDLSAALAAIDRDLLNLLVKRCDLLRKLGKSVSTCIEPSVLDVLDARVNRDAAAQWLRHANSLAFAADHKKRVAYLGPEYSYSHLAAIKVYGDAHPMAAVATIPAVFESIVRGDAVQGVVPIENSTDGRVVDTLGMFVRVSVKICGEVLLPIHHNLLSRTPRESITEVHSKPQALSQCRSWLANHLPKARLVEISSTAAAAELAANQPGIAAIASIEAGRKYGLDVIDASIEDNPNNVTRFAILGRSEPAASGNDKTTILFQVAHQPGALADAMVIFKEAGLNLTWIESFPVPGTNSEYLFFVEAVGHMSDGNVAKALQNLQTITLRLDVLGSYPRATKPLSEC
jgi:chorismate mutase/prephenate dehydratase